MQTKFKIVETLDYILAVSGEKVKENDLFTNEHIQISKCVKSLEKWLKHNKSGIKKIIAYQPKNNAPELDLLLLPEMAVGDDVEKLAEKLNIVYTLLKRRGLFDTGIEELLKIENLLIQARIEANEKSATKIYSEDDLRKAYQTGEGRGRCSKTGVQSYLSEEEFIQSLKQPTPTWFVAEMETPYTDAFTEDRVRRFYGKPNLKTTTIDGKTYLVGKFVNE